MTHEVDVDGIDPDREKMRKGGAHTLVSNVPQPRALGGAQSLHRLGAPVGRGKPVEHGIDDHRQLVG